MGVIGLSFIANPTGTTMGQGIGSGKGESAEQRDKC